MRTLIALLFLTSAAAPALGKHSPLPKNPDPAKAPPAVAGQPPAGAPAGPLTVEQTVVAMQKFYESTEDLHAKFEQELVSGIGMKKKASGELWIKKPGRMLWDYAKPEKKEMIADGNSLWVYEPEQEQAFKHDLKGSKSPLPGAVSFLFGTGKLSDEFTVTQDHPAGIAAGAPGSMVLKLVPIKATVQYSHVHFVIDGKTHAVTEMYVYDGRGGINHITFRDIETNKGVADAKFKFTPPPGTKIIKP